MQNIYVFVYFLKQTKTKAEIKQNSRGWVATPSFNNDLWVPDFPRAFRMNHFSRGTLKNFPVMLNFSGRLKVKMSKAYGLRPGRCQMIVRNDLMQH